MPGSPALCVMLTACSCVVNINKRTLDSYVSVPDFRLRNARTPHHQEFGDVMRSTELDIIDKTTTTTHPLANPLTHSLYYVSFTDSGPVSLSVLLSLNAARQLSVGRVRPFAKRAHAVFAETPHIIYYQRQWLH